MTAVADLLTAGVCNVVGYVWFGVPTVQHVIYTKNKKNVLNCFYLIRKTCFNALTGNVGRGHWWLPGGGCGHGDGCGWDIYGLTCMVVYT